MIQFHLDHEEYLFSIRHSGCWPLTRTCRIVRSSGSSACMTTPLYGQLSSVWCNHFGPFHQNSLDAKDSDFQPRDMMSPGLLVVGTWRHWQGLVKSNICAIRFETYDLSGLSLLIQARRMDESDHRVTFFYSCKVHLYVLALWKPYWLTLPGGGHHITLVVE